MKVSDKDLKRILREEISSVISKRSILKEEDDDNPNQEAHILQPQYTDFIRNACHILAWKGVDMDVNIAGNDYKAARAAIEQYTREKQEAMKSPRDNKAAVAAVKDKFRKRYPGLVDCERDAFEMFKQFKEDGFYFISTFIGGKTNSSKQMEKAAGFELFGIHDSGLNEFKIKHGAVFCVRDFFKWVDMGKPGLARRGERLKGKDKNLIRGKEEFAGVRSQGDPDTEMYNQHEDMELQGDSKLEIDRILEDVVNRVVDAINQFDNVTDQRDTITEAIKSTVNECAEEYGLPSVVLLTYVKAALGAATGVSKESLRDRLEAALEQSHQDQAAMDNLKSTVDANGGRLAECIEEVDGVDFSEAAPHKSKLLELLDEGLIDAKETAENLVRWISDDDAAKFMQMYEIFDDRDGDEEEI